jgi:hypothetical protein
MEYGIEIRDYTLFPFGEHVLFALQAIPLADGWSLRRRACHSGDK